jgi:phosphoglycolate phosphatase
VIPQFPVYLFDIDGTLLDSAPDICAAVQQVITSNGALEREFEYLRGYVGFHLIDLFQDVFPAFDTARIDGLIHQYRTIYLGRCHQRTKVFAGAKEALSVLGGRKSTATTKGTPTTRAVLTQFDLVQHFDHVQGTDNGLPYKPKPDVLLVAMNALGARPEECLMIGDSTADMAAGHAAGMKTCAVRYGYGDKDAMALHTPDYWVDDLRELLP